LTIVLLLLLNFNRLRLVLLALFGFNVKYLMVSRILLVVAANNFFCSITLYITFIGFHLPKTIQQISGCG